jgi:hypothetical protein
MFLADNDGFPMMLYSHVHDSLGSWHTCDIYPCFYWLLRPTLPSAESATHCEQVGKNLPIIGKIGHRNRFKYQIRNLRNLEALAVVTGMKIAKYTLYRRRAW